MRDNIDDLLKEALTSSEKPDAELKRRILDKAGEENSMKRPFLKTIPAVLALSIAVLATGSLTAYGAWKYLGAGQVAEEFGDDKLADVFKGENAILVNESQICGDYKITLMGTASGDNISRYITEADGELITDRTYTVISIEKKDGSPMLKTSDENWDNKFLASPFIKGEDPVHLNIFYMSGGTSTFVKDGVEYRIVEHDNIEVFADRGVYFGVIDNTFYDKDAYNFDKKTGEITPNSDYKGINALFELPLDKSKADEKLAEEQLKKWYSDDEEDTDGAEDTEDSGNTSDKETLGNKESLKAVQEERVEIKESKTSRK